VARRLNMRTPVGLLENDGVLVCGSTVLDAFDRLEVTESTAETQIYARYAGKVNPMSEVAIDDLTKAFGLE